MFRLLRTRLGGLFDPRPWPITAACAADSESAKQLGKTIELFHRRRHLRSGDDIPVIYITVPPAATPKMIAAELARYLGLPVTRRANITDIIEAVCGVCTDTCTSVICVDFTDRYHSCS